MKRLPAASALGAVKLFQNSTKKCFIDVFVPVFTYCGAGFYRDLGSEYIGALLLRRKQRIMGSNPGSSTLSSSLRSPTVLFCQFLFWYFFRNETQNTRSDWVIVLFIFIPIHYRKKRRLQEFFNVGTERFRCCFIITICLKMKDFDRNRLLTLNSPDRPFHNFRALRSGDRQILCSSRRPYDGFKSSKIVKGSVGQNICLLFTLLIKLCTLEVFNNRRI